MIAKLTLDFFESRVYTKDVGTKLKLANGVTSMDTSAEIIDVEEHFKQNKAVPPGKRYKIRIDKATFEIASAHPTGRQLLELAGKTPPERYKIFQVINGKKIPVGLEEKVDLTKPGVEKFVTLPLDQTEGV